MVSAACSRAVSTYFPLVIFDGPTVVRFKPHFSYILMRKRVHERNCYKQRNTGVPVVAAISVETSETLPVGYSSLCLFVSGADAFNETCLVCSTGTYSSSQG